MELWIGVEVFQLIVQDVHVFKTGAEAEQWFREWTKTIGHPEGWSYDEFYHYNLPKEDEQFGVPQEEDYDQSRIYRVEVPWLQAIK